MLDAVADADAVGLAGGLVPRPRPRSAPVTRRPRADELDACSTALPGELAPKLALGMAAELAGDPAAAAAWYEVVSRTDPGVHVGGVRPGPLPACARRPRGAIAAYGRVPDTSSAHVDARSPRPTCCSASAGPTSTDVAAAAAIVERLPLDASSGRAGGPDPGGGAGACSIAADTPTRRCCVARPFTERDLRLGSRRRTARSARGGHAAERIALVDRANRVRPRTWCERRARPALPVVRRAGDGRRRVLRVVRCRIGSTRGRPGSRRARPGRCLAAVSDRGLVHERNEDALLVDAARRGSSPSSATASRVGRAPSPPASRPTRPATSRSPLLGRRRVRRRHVRRALGRRRGRRERPVDGDPAGHDAVVHRRGRRVGRRRRHRRLGRRQPRLLGRRRRPTLLTTDHSWAQEQVGDGADAGGRPPPTAHVITRWLGADAPATRPSRPPRTGRPGRLLSAPTGCGTTSPTTELGPARRVDGPPLASPGARRDRRSARGGTTTSPSPCRHRPGQRRRRGAAWTSTPRRTRTSSCRGGDARRRHRHGAPPRPARRSATAPGGHRGGARARRLRLDGPARQARHALQRAAAAAIASCATASCSASSPAPPRPAASTRRAAGLAIASAYTRAASDGGRRAAQPGGGTAIGRWLHGGRDLLAPARVHPPRHPAHRRPGPDETRTTSSAAVEPLRRRVPVRLPRRRHRLAGRGAAGDRLGAARVGRHHRRAGRTWPPTSTPMMHGAMAKRTADVALRLWTPRGATSGS